MTKLIKSFLADESGASAAEYALILALVGAGIALAAYNLGTAISTTVNSAATCVSGAGTALNGGSAPTGC